MAKKIETKSTFRITVDCGKNETKIIVVDELGRIRYAYSFPTRIKRLPDFNCMDIKGIDAPLFNVYWNEDFFQIGDAPSAQCDTSSSKNTEHHQVCIYTAIAKVLDVFGENDADIHLTLGFPTSDYDDEEVQELKTRMLNFDAQGKIELKLNEKPVEFNIERILVSAEGSCLIPLNLHPEAFGPLTYTLDIGGFNSNYRALNQYGSTLEVPGSLDDAGVNLLHGRVKAELRRVLSRAFIDLNTLDYNELIRTLELPLREKDKHLLPKVQETLRKIVIPHIQEQIINPLILAGYNLMSPSTSLVFTGGGSLLLRHYLEEIFEEKRELLFFSETGKWDNALAYAYLTLNNYALETELTEAEATEIFNQFFDDISKIDWSSPYYLAA